MQKNTEMLTTFLPGELLDMAGEHEHFEMNRYRIMSLRFLTFNAGISRLLEALSNENEQRLQTLTQAAERIKAKAFLPTNTKVASVSMQHGKLSHSFFVTGNAMAANTLAEALVYEQRSLGFYRQLRAGNVTHSLDKLLVIFIEQALIQCHILQDVQDQLLLNEPAIHSRAA
ncbi:MAG TPA: hypothetical protein VFM75_06645 [Modicisalibacter sp.]|nr:hypothetical protein [Modicisalibacter sp.]